MGAPAANASLNVDLTFLGSIEAAVAPPAIVYGQNEETRSDPDGRE